MQRAWLLIQTFMHLMPLDVVHVKLSQYNDQFGVRFDTPPTTRVELLEDAVRSCNNPFMVKQRATTEN